MCYKAKRLRDSSILLYGIPEDHIMKVPILGILMGQKLADLESCAGSAGGWLLMVSTKVTEVSDRAR